jgi:DNA-binding transcriptional ArsR family regulator
MSMTVLDLLLHPVRLRIVNAMSGGRTLTTAQLGARLREIPQATLYRHVGILVDGGILEVDGEVQVRGTVERRYRLSQERARITADMAKSMSLDQHRFGFASAMATLIAEFNAYLEQEGANPYADSVGYRQFTLWLTDAECAALVEEVSAALISRFENEPSAERRPYLASTILFPTEPRTTRATGRQSRSKQIGKARAPGRKGR